MDDEEELVRQVINENPPEDRGVRPEWGSHQGWHRVEDTHRNNHAEGEQGKKLPKDEDRDGGGEASGEVITDYNINDDDPLEPMIEEKPDGQVNWPVGGGAVFNSVAMKQVDDLEGRTSPGAVTHALRGVKVGNGNVAQEKATIMRKPLTIGFAAVVFLVYITLQRRRTMKRTKDML